MARDKVPDWFKCAARANSYDDIGELEFWKTVCEHMDERDSEERWLADLQATISGVELHTPYEMATRAKALFGADAR